MNNGINNNNNININNNNNLNEYLFWKIYKNIYLKKIIFIYLRLFNNFNNYSFYTINDLKKFKYKEYLSNISINEINQTDLYYLNQDNLPNLECLNLKTNYFDIVKELNQINKKLKIELTINISDEYLMFPENVIELHRKVIARFHNESIITTNGYLINNNNNIIPIYSNNLIKLEIPYFNGDSLPNRLKYLKIGTLSTFNILPKETLEYLEIDKIKMSITFENGLKEFSQLKTLKLANQSQIVEIEENSLPSNLEILDTKWSGGLKSNTLPSNLRVLKMVSAILLSPNSYPVKLVDFEFTEIIHSPLSKNQSFPINLETLKVNNLFKFIELLNSENGYNGDMVSNSGSSTTSLSILPKSIKKLILTKPNSNLSTTTTTLIKKLKEKLPSSIIDIEIPELNEIYYSILPLNNLQYLRITSIESNSYLKSSLIPHTITSLHLPQQFNNPFTSGDLSNHLNLKQLEFGQSFDQQIVINSLPPNLQSLIFNKTYNQPFIKYSIPESVTSIQLLSSSFEQTITKECLPKNLKILNLSSSKAIIDSFPDNLEFLLISKSNYFIFNQLNKFEKQLNHFKIIVE